MNNRYRYNSNENFIVPNIYNGRNNNNGRNNIFYNEDRYNTINTINLKDSLKKQDKIIREQMANDINNLKIFYENNKKEYKENLIRKEQLIGELQEELDNFKKINKIIQNENRQLKNENRQLKNENDVLNFFLNKENEKLNNLNRKYIYLELDYDILKKEYEKFKEENESLKTINVELNKIFDNFKIENKELKRRLNGK